MQSKQLKNPNLSLLLSFDQEKVVSKNTPDPYVYKILLNTTLVCVYGTQHTSNPYELRPLIDIFNEFEPDIVFYEGRGGDMKKINTIEEAMRYGEPILAHFLAQNKGVKAVSWDLRIEDSLTRSIKNFGEDNVLGWVVAQLYKNYKGRYGVDPTNSKDIWDFLNKYLDTNAVFGREVTVEDISKLALQYSQRPIEEWDQDLAESLASPRYNGPTNMVNRFMLSLRDPNAVEKIFDHTQRFKRILVVAGKGHAVTWKPVFEDAQDTLDL